MCMNVRELGLFPRNFPNNLCERHNCQKTVFPLILSGMAVLFPVLRTEVPSSRAPNMILSQKHSLIYWARHLWPDFLSYY